MRSLFITYILGTGWSSTDDRYACIGNVRNTLAGNYPVAIASESTVFNIIPMDMYIEELYVDIDTAPGILGSGKRYDITLMRNGVDTEITLPFIETMTTSTYTPSTPLLLSKGDIVKYRIEPTNSPATGGSPKFVMIIRTENTNNYPIFNGAWTISPQTSYRYNFFAGYYQSGPLISNIDTCNSICTVSGTLTNLYVKLEKAMPVSASARFAVFKNKVVTNLYVDITAGSDSGETVLDVDIVPGDLLSFGNIRLAGSPGINHLSYGITFRSDVDGEFPLFPATDGFISNTALSSFSIASITGDFGNPTTINAGHTRINYEVKFRDFFVQLQNAPGAGKSRSFSLYKNGVITDLGLTISNTDVSGNDITDEIQCVEGDYVVIGSTPSGTPATTAQPYIGMGAFLNQVQTTLVEDPVNASIGCADVIGYVSGNLDHLEGKEVIILADGEVIEGRTVVGGALVPALDHSYASVTVGLPYDSDMITLGTEDD